MWQIELQHPGLNKYRFIRGKDRIVVEQKAAVQQAAWDEMWLIKLEKEQRSLIKQLNHEQAKLRTLEAVKAIEELKNILQHTLGFDDAIDWEVLKNKKTFKKQKPQLSQPQEIPQAPLQTAPQYQPKFNFLDVLIPSREDKKIKHTQELYKTDYQYWEVQKEKILKRDAASEKEYLEQLQL